MTDELDGVAFVGDHVVVHQRLEVTAGSTANTKTRAMKHKSVKKHHIFLLDQSLLLLHHGRRDAAAPAANVLTSRIDRQHRPNAKVTSGATMALCVSFTYLGTQQRRLQLLVELCAMLYCVYFLCRDALTYATHYDDSLVIVVSFFKCAAEDL